MPSGHCISPLPCLFLVLLRNVLLPYRIRNAFPALPGASKGRKICPGRLLYFALPGIPFPPFFFDHTCIFCRLSNPRCFILVSVFLLHITHLRNRQKAKPLFLQCRENSFQRFYRLRIIIMKYHNISIPNLPAAVSADRLSNHRGCLFTGSRQTCKIRRSLFGPSDHFLYPGCTDSAEVSGRNGRIVDRPCRRRIGFLACPGSDLAGEKSPEKTALRRVLRVNIQPFARRR